MEYPFGDLTELPSMQLVVGMDSLADSPHISLLEIVDTGRSRR